VFALLGQWQLRRANDAEAAAANFARRAFLPAFEVLPDANAVGDLRYRKVVLRGHYLPQVQVLIDNMTYEGRAGYHVLTPFVATGGVVAVNRGFVPAPASRNELPVVAVSAEERAVRGRIETLPVPALRLDTEDSGTGPVRVVSFPDAKDLGHAFGRPVADYQILLDATERDGFTRAWEPSGIRAERNLVYAGQWFALSLATLVAALGLLIRSQRRKRTDA
jgi:surfeit locus 1 family protein